MKEHLLFWPTWLRGLFMLLFIIVYGVLRFLVLAVTIFQFGSLLFTGRINELVLDFGESLSIYTYQVTSYLTYNSDEKPFPFHAWPSPTDNPFDVENK